MAFIEPMHRNKPNITYLLTSHNVTVHFREGVMCGLGGSGTHVG